MIFRNALFKAGIVAAVAVAILAAFQITLRTSLVSVSKEGSTFCVLDRTEACLAPVGVGAKPVLKDLSPPTVFLAMGGEAAGMRRPVGLSGTFSRLRASGGVPPRSLVGVVELRL